MLRLSSSIIVRLCLAVFCIHNNDDGSVSSVFNSLKRTDHSGLLVRSSPWNILLIEWKILKILAATTYHFSRIGDYEPVNEPIIYADGFKDNTKMIVGFSNIRLFWKWKALRHSSQWRSGWRHRKLCQTILEQQWQWRIIWCCYSEAYHYDNDHNALSQISRHGQRYTEPNRLLATGCS